jgi:putative oxidoreductase
MSDPNRPAPGALARLVLGSRAHVAGPILRLTLAAVILPHGLQKVFGMFGGYGWSGTMGYLTGSIGLPTALAALVILIEFLAPIALLFGLLTRLAAVGIVAVMLGAVETVHRANGFFMNWTGQQKGEGFEYHLLVIGIALALILAGGGCLSLDRRIARSE